MGASECKRRQLLRCHQRLRELREVALRAHAVAGDAAAKSRAECGHSQCGDQCMRNGRAMATRLRYVSGAATPVFGAECDLIQRGHRCVWDVCAVAKGSAAFVRHAAKATATKLDC